MTKIRNVRNITKFKRSINAISPVIATLLMIAIAVVASLVVYAWVSGYLGFQTSKAGEAISLPSFTGVANPSTPGQGALAVYVQNVGQGTVEVSAVYVDDELRTDWAVTPSGPIEGGNTVQVTITGPFDLTKSYDIKVTTTSGTFMTTSGKPASGGNIAPAVPIISLNPSGGPSGTTVTVSGTGFAATSAITVRFNSVVQTTVPASVTTSAAGAFSCTFNVPSIANGDYSVSATDASSGTDSDTFTVATVVIPTITLNPASGPVGTSVSVSGTGFTASTPLTATFAGSSVTLSGTTSTDGSGAFTGATFTVPAATTGDKTVHFAADSTSDDATFTVTPVITLNPTSGPSGTTVTVSGTGFAATSAITVRFNSVVQTTVPASVTTSAAGAFSCTFNVPTITAGSYPVSATDANSGSDSETFSIEGTTTMTLLSDGFEQRWQSTSWDRSTDQKYGGSYSMKSDRWNDGGLTTMSIDAQGTSITVDFWYRHSNIDDSDLEVYLQDQYTNWDRIAQLGDDGSNDNWEHYTYTTTDSQYRTSYFSVSIDSDLGSSQYVWIDDVQITVTGGPATIFTDNFENADQAWNAKWMSTDWDPSSTAYSGSVVSALSSDFWGEGAFTCNNLDASQASSITVDFWFMLDDTENTDFALYFYDGSTYDKIIDLGTYGTSGTWLHYTYTTTDNQYFDSTFRIQFSTTLGNGENIWVDDVLVTSQVPA